MTNPLSFFNRLFKRNETSTGKQIVLDGKSAQGTRSPAVKPMLNAAASAAAAYAGGRAMSRPVRSMQPRRKLYGDIAQTPSNLM